MHTSTGQGLRFGGRRTGGWTRLSRVQVRSHRTAFDSALARLVQTGSLVGTGGTIAGVGQFLKSMSDPVRIVLADPEGSGIYNKVRSVVFVVVDVCGGADAGWA